MLHRCLVAALALATFAPSSDAGPRRRTQPSYQYPSYQYPTYQYPTYQYPTYQQPAFTPADGYSTVYAQPVTPADGYVTSYTPATPTDQPASYDQSAWAGTGDGLDEVNAKRAARGLRPFLRDEGLTHAARACAAYRAQYGLFGHTSNDFSFVPPGSSASSAGCAAYPASYGWMSCCVYENYTYGGAAYVTGADGKRYMHLFVR